MFKIKIAKSSGFCFGVKRAIQLARDTAQRHKKIFMLGDIVHNPRVVNDIKKMGIRKIRRLVKNGKRVLIIPAHGAPESVYHQARRKNYRIIDATCPMVKEIQAIAKRYEKRGYRIIIIGDATHDEVIGIKGNVRTTPVVISEKKDITVNRLRGIDRAVVVVQSTQNLEYIDHIFKKLKKIIRKIKFFNTICYPTRQKQKEIKLMPKINDAMVVIGAKSSANTKRLFEISKSINPNTFWVNSRNQLKKEWFIDKRRIGITAGASTPDYIIKEIKNQIKKFKAAG
ncbi:MAG: 4-hydroxy-3-methylbut-2-enyl diphosphate reductase [Candidatus Omnitrophica bacterium]|nr:4-hydroxy-3-methylbut-2-enyl diphosphate reductase [Candidatus Omnitrophota bacterium]